MGIELRLGFVFKLGILLCRCLHATDGAETGTARRTGSVLFPDDKRRSDAWFPERVPYRGAVAGVATAILLGLAFYGTLAFLLIVLI